MQALADSTIARWFSPAALARNPTHLEKVRHMILTTPVNGFAGCSAALSSHNFRSSLEKVSKPVLFVVGAEDGTLPAAMRQMNAELPGAQLVELPEAGHISNLDQRSMFSHAVERFLTASN